MPNQKKQTEREDRLLTILKERGSIRIDCEVDDFLKEIDRDLIYAPLAEVVLSKRALRELLEKNRVKITSYGRLLLSDRAGRRTSTSDPGEEIASDD